MPGRAKSTELKQYEYRLQQEALYKRALDAYREQPGGRSTRRGYRQVALDHEKLHYTETGKHIKLDWSTLRRREEGQKSISEARQEAQLLNREEDATLTSFLQSSADQGFPCTFSRVEEAANIDPTTGSDFPKCWKDMGAAVSHTEEGSKGVGHILEQDT